MSSYLIVIQGAPASGKTHLSQLLSNDLHLPLLSKDDLKEELFNHFTYNSVADSKKIGAASFDLLWLLLQKLMPFGHPYIVETAFHLEYSTPKLRDLSEEFGYKLIQVYCFAEKSVLIQRYKDRAKHSRHPGHKDAERAKDLGTEVDLSMYNQLPLSCPTITVDTTNFESVDLGIVADKIRTIVAKL